MNKIGLTQSEVELDFTTAAEILRKAAAQRTQDEGDFNNLFTAPTTDPTAQEPADVYFPMWRRDEAPIIEIQEARDSSPGRVMISVGAVEATPPEEEGPEMPASEPGFWKTPGTRSARDIVDAKYGVGVRNIAPVIEFGDVEYSVSLEMKTILGECEADLYPSESRFYAPEIRMKKPAGEWDHTGYVEVSSVEVQLPLMKAERMKH